MDMEFENLLTMVVLDRVCLSLAALILRRTHTPHQGKADLGLRLSAQYSTALPELSRAALAARTRRYSPVS